MNTSKAVTDPRTVAGKIVRFGVEWSADGKQWLGIINDKSLNEAEAHFRANTATHKRIVKHEITRTVL